MRGLDLFPDTVQSWPTLPVFQQNSRVLPHYRNVLRHYNLVSVLVSVGRADSVGQSSAKVLKAGQSAMDDYDSVVTLLAIADIDEGREVDSVAGHPVEKKSLA